MLYPLSYEGVCGPSRSASEPSSFKNKVSLVIASNGLPPAWKSSGKRPPTQANG